jgi:hypothetical protein
LDPTIGQVTPTEDEGSSPGADVASDAGASAKGHPREILATVLRSLYVDPYTKLAKDLGITVKSVVLFYVFAVLVVGVPATALFLKRGLPASLHDGEAFLFSLALTLGVLYDHAKQSFEKDILNKKAFADVFRPQTLGYVVLNLGALVVSIYYIVTSSDSGAIRGIADGRLVWFGVTVFLAIGLPLAAFLPFGDAADATPEPRA